MKIVKILLIFTIVFFSYTLFSQTDKAMSRKTERLIKSGRNSIIKSALKEINETIDINHYLIQVKANKTSLIVSFQIPIVFLPLNSVYNYNYGIDLIAGSSWSGIISNPYNYGTDQNDIPNYTPSEETQKHIQIVLDAIQKSDEIASINIEDFSFNDSMIIRDNLEYYEIYMLSPHQESFYKIEKKNR